MKNILTLSLALSLAPVNANSSSKQYPVYQPTFNTNSQNISAGKIFYIKLKNCNKNFLITAYHLFGPSGGFSKLLRPEEIATHIKSMDLEHIVSGKSIQKIKAISITPRLANVCCGNKNMTGVGDVAIFKILNNLKLRPLLLASNAVKKGDKLYVITASSVSTNYIHEAIAYGMQNGYLMYDFTGPFSIRATSGAPVINNKGRVVAINLGGGKLGKTNKMYGFGNPVTAWKQTLKSKCN